MVYYLFVTRKRDKTHSKCLYFKEIQVPDRGLGIWIIFCFNVFQVRQFCFTHPSIVSSLFLFNMKQMSDCGAGKAKRNR